jgi:putative transposase
MARKPRFNMLGNPQHVIQRGNNRQATFFAEADYRLYLDCLAEAARKYDCAIHAYVLMTNHVHLLVTPGQVESIARLMQSVGRRYVQYINYSYKRSGTLWEGRYKASLIQSEQYLLTCMRYIELNPVRAGMMERPEDYKWSSYRANAHGTKDELLTPHAEYEALGTTPEQQREAYRELFKAQLNPETLTEVRTALNGELVTGTGRFQAEIETMLGRRVQAGRRGRPRKQVETTNLSQEKNKEQRTFMEGI